MGCARKSGVAYRRADILVAMFSSSRTNLLMQVEDQLRSCRAPVRIGSGKFRAGFDDNHSPSVCYSSTFSSISKTLHSDEAPRLHPEYSQAANQTAKMSDDEERVTMPFKFVTGE